MRAGAPPPDERGRKPAPESLAETVAPEGLAETVAPEGLAETVVPESLADTVAPERGAGAVGAEPDALSATVAAPASGAATPAASEGARPTFVSVEQAGRYRFKDEQGRGGMGRVLLVFDEHVGRDVALKELLGDAAPTGDGAGVDPAVVGRFYREARVTGQLEHPSIVPVYEIGRRAAQRTPYYTMRLVRGETLKQAIGARETLDERLALLPHFVDLCNALAYAHSRGVIHRDVKPHNVMIGSFGETVVLDWGLAKVRDVPDEEDERFAATMGAIRDVAAGLTVAGSTLGTPSYMAPEQASGELERIGEASDIYAMGAVLYELLTGAPPFSGRSGLDVLDKVQRYGRGELPLLPARELCAEVPAELSAIVDKALARRPEERYGSAKALVAELEAFIAGRRVSVYEYSSWELLRRFAAKNRLALILVSLIFATIVAALIGVTLSYRKEAAARREASYRLAQAFDEKALRLIEDRRYVGARVYAAASLLHNPAHPLSPEHDPSFVARHPDSAVVHAEAASKIYQAAQHELLLLRRERVDEVAFDVAFSPDHRRLAAAAWDNAVHVWDARSLGGHRKLTGHSGKVVGVAFSPDGRLLASAAWDRTVRLWDAASGATRQVLRGHGHRVQCVAFSPDGALLATASYDGTVRLWDARSGAQRVVLQAHAGGANGVAFSPDGRLLASTGNDRAVKLWDAATGEARRTLGVHESAAHGVAFSPDGRLLASTSYDKTVRLWPLPEGQAVNLRGHRDRVYDAAFSPDGSLLVSAGHDRSLRLWRVPSGELLSTGDGHADGLYGVAFSPDGAHIATAGSDRTVRLWRTRPRRPVQALEGHARSVYGVAYFADGKRLASASGDGSVRLWRLDRPDAPAERVLPGQADRSFEVALSRDGTRVAASGYDGTVRLFDAAQGRLLHTLRVDTQPVFGVALTPDGRLLAAGGGTPLVQLFDARSGKLRRKLAGHRGTIWRLAFSPDGRLLASASGDRTVRLWDVGRGRLLRVLAGHADWVTGLSFSPDGARLATSGKDARVILWDVASGRELRRLRAHEQWVNAVVFSPDGRLLISGSDDHSFAVWTADARRLLLRVTLPAEVGGLACAPDSRQLAVSSDRRIALYPLDFSQLEADPRRLLDEAQRAARVRLEGVELVPAE